MASACASADAGLCPVRLPRWGDMSCFLVCDLGDGLQLRDVVPSSASAGTWITNLEAARMDYAPPELPEGSGASWGHAPPYHHLDLRYRVHVSPGRRVLRLPDRRWDCTPETCDRTDFHGEWVLHNTVLICPRCGLDCTPRREELK